MHSSQPSPMASDACGSGADSTQEELAVVPYDGGQLEYKSSVHLPDRDRDISPSRQDARNPTQDVSRLPRRPKPSESPKSRTPAGDVAAERFRSAPIAYIGRRCYATCISTQSSVQPPFYSCNGRLSDVTRQFNQVRSRISRIVCFLN